MRVFKNKWFQKWAAKEGLSDEVLLAAVEEMEDGLICLAWDGAVTGSVAGDIVGDPERGAEIGAAIAIASGLIRSDYLNQRDNPEARRTISGFERELRNWDRKFAACLRPKGYRVSSP